MHKAFNQVKVDVSLAFSPHFFNFPIVFLHLSQQFLQYLVREVGTNEEEDDVEIERVPRARSAAQSRRRKRI